MTAAVGVGPVGMTLARVTVAAPRRRIDVALPEDIPVAELLPNLLRHAGESAADDGEQHGGWVLRRATGTLLEPARNLAVQGVRDGEVLHLLPRRVEWPELEYDDVVEAIASGARRYGRSWGAAATRRCTLAVGTAVIVLGLADLLLAKPPLLVPGIVGIGFALILAVVGITMSRAMADGVAGAAIAGSGLPFAFLGGCMLAIPAKLNITAIGAPHLLLGSVLLLVFGLIGYIGVSAFLRLFAAAVVTGLLGILGGLLGYTSMSSGGNAAVVLTVGIALMPAYPLLSLRVGKLPMPTLPQRAEEMLNDEPMPKRSDVFSAVARSDEVLTGLLLGVGLVSLVSMGYLIMTGKPSAVVLSVVACLALLLRARLFPTPRQRISLLVAGVGGLALLAVGAAVVMPSSLHLVLMLVAMAILGSFVMMLGLMYSRRPPSPYMGRIADIADVLAIVALVPITCLVVGLYAYIQDAFASIGLS